MYKQAVNPDTGNTISFYGGEWEYEMACMDDSNAAAEWKYEQACFAVGLVPYEDTIFDQPEVPAKRVNRPAGWIDF